MLFFLKAEVLQKTIIKKDNYDVDIFLMFSENLRGKIFQNLQKLLKELRECP